MRGPQENGPGLVQRVRELVRRPPVTCAPATAAFDVAALMSRERVGSVIVLDAGAAPVGIVTDRDLRGKLVARGGDPRATPASALMSAPLITVRSDAFVFEAMLEMTRREIHHLVVVDDRGGLAGVLSSTDLLARHSTDPVVLARRISTAPSVGDLAVLGDRVTELVGRLFRAGARAHDIGQLVAELNDRVVVRVLGLATAALAASGGAPAPVPWCWLALGSEARREQTLRTDQDSALVYGDAPPGQAEAARAYCTRLATAVTDGLVGAGFPRCEGNFMASNPEWCLPLGAWRARFHGWIAGASRPELLPASIFFDLRPLAGAVELGASLRDVVVAEAPAHRPFLAALAREVVTSRVPRTLLGGIAVARRGPRRGTVDVKGAGVTQIVGAARVDALDLGLPETNTADRLRGAAARGRYTEAEVREITDAYQHLLRLRLGHQLARLEQGMAPDNFVDPEALSHADRVLFQEALGTVSRVQGGLRQRFATDFVPS